MTSPPRARLAGLLTATLGVLLLAGCEDPSAVGLTILNPGDTDPRTQAVPASDLGIERLPDETGFAAATGALNARVLAGRAEDPLFGTVTATGYMDVTRPATVPGEFIETPISRVVLRLRPDYRYGDTTATVTFDLHEVLESWNAPSLVSDTTLAVRGEVVTSFSVSAADTLVHVEMPVTWVEDRNPLLRAADFNAAFHGFQIRPRDGGRLALGFDGGGSDLLVLSGQGEAADSVSYFTSAIFSSVTREVPLEAALPQGLIPLQDGPSQGLVFDLRLDALGAPALSAGFVRIEADTTLLVQNRPAGFARPMSRTLILYGIGSGAPVQLAEGVFDARRQGYVFSSTLLTGVFQNAALGRPLFERYAVGFPRSPSTLNVAPLVSTPAAPVRAVLLLVPGTD